jgi:antitoxin CcdA
MKQAYDRSAPKKPTNLSVNSDLLARARSLRLNLSSTLETALADEVRKAERIRWLERNQKAIDAANELAEDTDLFADSYRTI